MALNYCPACFEKQRQIDDLKEEVRLLKDRLRYQERTIAEGPFGSSTPSSKVPIKPSSLPERQAKKGGGRPGHVGHGRGSLDQRQADRVQDVPAPQCCPDCRHVLEGKGHRERSVLDCPPVRVEKVLYRLERKRCPNCGKVIQAQAPQVLPKCQYGNGAMAYFAVQHYLHGQTLGQLERQTGIGYSSIIDALRQLGRRLESVPDELLREYRNASVMHADETSWRTDGGNGYAWLFCTEDLSLFRFRKTRSASVALEVLGKGPLGGVLVVDRYGGYNRAPCKMQYCYAHLLRDLKDIEKEFPDHPEVRQFVEALAPLLGSAMGLRGLKLPRRAFARQATTLRDQIVATVNQPARHPAIQSFQDIFRHKAHRLYHWADDAAVPADNNLAERELRPLVVARKISFGSQSDAGAHTREVLMTILHTLRKRTSDPAAAFKAALDQLAQDPHADPFALLFPKPP